MGCFYNDMQLTQLSFVVVLPQLLFKLLCAPNSQQWVLESKMKINFRKSSVMWFKVSSCSTGFSYPPISIDGVELTVTKK